MKFYIIVILLSSVKLLFSQNHYSYIGTLILSNNTPLSFQIQFIEDKGHVNGFSITNIGTVDETKSEISGFYFKSDKSFQLQETQILYTNSEASLNTFCYINMNLSFTGLFGKKQLEGTFTGNYLDNTNCASGRVILIEEKKIKKKMIKLEKKLQKKVKENNTKIDFVKKIKVLSEGEKFSIKKWKNNTVTLFIWDPSKEDGDKIELKINNQVILENFETKNKKKKINFKLKKGENIIEIQAKNEGFSPPNTSRIELVDNKIKYPVITQLELGKSAIIKIYK